MSHSHTSLKDIFGYAAMLAAIAIMAFTYTPILPASSPLFHITILGLAGSAAIITITVSIFWLWKPERVQWLENYFGIIGHIPHCGYCLSLWISAFYTRVFGISFLNISAAPFIKFLISWWALSFLSVLFFETTTILWFKKVQMEFQLRDLYKRSDNIK
jgi:hypothetical protein